MCMQVDKVYVIAGAHRDQRRALGALELEFQTPLSFLMSILGAAPRSSTRTATILNPVAWVSVSHVQNETRNPRASSASMRAV